MTDSLEARRAALVENLTRLGFVKEHNGYGWDRWKRPTGGGQVLVSASPMVEGSSSGFLVWAEDQIAPLLAIEAAAFARGVESRQGAGDAQPDAYQIIVERHNFLRGAGQKPLTHDDVMYLRGMQEAARVIREVRTAPPAKPPVDVEGCVQRWIEDTYGIALAYDPPQLSRTELIEFAEFIAAALVEPVDVEAALEPLTLAQLGALPVGSVVLDDRELSWQMDESGMWTRLDWRCTSGDMLITFGPVRLLHTGTVTTRED